MIALSTIALGQITPENVLLVYNEASPDGSEIAQYYKQTHPGVQLLGLTGVSTNEEVTADHYLSAIRPQIFSALSPSIDVIVTTKGLPLRIKVEQSKPSSGYTDPDGTLRTAYAWQTYSSLESELARIDTVSMWEQMGDQTYWMPDGLPHPACNPYYQEDSQFDNETFEIRLSSRLDGFTVDDVKGSIDRAQQAYLYPSSASVNPVVVVDDDPNGHYDLMPELNDQLTARKQSFIYETSSSAVTTSENRVIGYVSHGTHSSELLAEYISDQLDFSLADGAVFHTRESFNAITFAENENQYQGLVGEWIAEGGTVGVGHVQEPGNNKENVTNEDQMFSMLLDGYTWAEAAWSATYQLSYVNTVVGDPLMEFKRLIPGDASKDGKVDTNDLGQVSYYYGTHDLPGIDVWACGDFDGDGLVGISDLGVIACNWGAVADWHVSPPVQAVPEPTALLLAVAGMVMLFAGIRQTSHHTQLSASPNAGRVSRHERMLKNFQKPAFGSTAMKIPLPASFR